MVVDDLHGSAAEHVGGAHEQREADLLRTRKRLLDGPRGGLRRRLVAEALRREVISRAKAREICDLAQVQPDEFKALVATVEQEPEQGPKGRRAHVPRG